MVSFQVDLVPFTIPNFVSQRMPPRPRQEGMQAAPIFRLGELPDVVLDKLCAEFRAGVFTRAAEQRKENPPRVQS
jgi:hypothetical protein